MSFLEDLFGKRKMPSSGNVFSLECEMHPYRVEAHKSSVVDLEIKLTNQFGKELLTSVTIRVPKGLGFDQTALSNEREIRLGQVAPGEVRKLSVPVYGTQRTEHGEHKVEIFATSHYRDYSYVLNQAKKTLFLRAV